MKDYETHQAACWKNPYSYVFKIEVVEMILNDKLTQNQASKANGLHLQTISGAALSNNTCNLII